MLTERNKLNQALAVRAGNKAQSRTAAQHPRERHATEGTGSDLHQIRAQQPQLVGQLPGRDDRRRISGEVLRRPGERLTGHPGGAR
eukprot:5838910-Alexandrium_andersonii.AAC.1